MKNKVTILLITAAAVSAIFLSVGLVNNIKQENLYQSCIEMFQKIKPQISTDNDPDTDALLSQCLRVNPQTTAWLTVDDTDIDFPVAAGNDNEYYLGHDFSGSESRSGNPFLDYRCAVDFSDFSNIIYGHNLKGGQMFADVLRYTDKEYFRSHNKGTLITNDNVYDITFFACLKVSSDDFIYDVVLKDNDDKLRYLDEIRNQASVYSAYEDVKITDMKLIILSTCSYESENARTVLAGMIFK